MNGEKIKTITICVLLAIIVLLVFVSQPRTYIWTNILLRKAVSAAKNSNFNEAEGLYKIIIQKDPNNVRAFKGLGNILAIRGDYDSAIICYKKVYMLGDPYGLRLWASMYIRMNHADKISDLVQDLMIYRKDNVENVIILLTYAIASKDEKLFLRIMDGLPNGYVAKSQDAMKLIEKATKLFNSSNTFL